MSSYGASIRAHVEAGRTSKTSLAGFRVSCASVFCPQCHGDYPETWKHCPKDAVDLLKSSRIGKYAIVVIVAMR